MTSQTAWIQARTVRDELRAAGIGESDLFAAVACACLTGRATATGFTHVDGGGHRAAASDRRIVSTRLWRVFERADANWIPHPYCDDGDSAARQRFQRIVRWDCGEFTWTLGQGESRVQETWKSVLFDRPSFELWIAEIRARAGGEVLQDHEIQGWIERDCTTENSREAWDLFKHAFGARAGKKLNYERVWRAAKGNRGRGRPKVQSIITP